MESRGSSLSGKAVRTDRGQFQPCTYIELRHETKEEICALFKDIARSQCVVSASEKKYHPICPIYICSVLRCETKDVPGVCRKYIVSYVPFNL